MRVPSAPIRASSRGSVPARRSSVAMGCAMPGAMGAPMYESLFKTQQLLAALLSYLAPCSSARVPVKVLKRLRQVPSWAALHS